MEVKVAETAGFCFGVKRAVGLTYEAADRSGAGSVYTIGPIIHNEYVVEDLKKHGVAILDEELRIEGTGEVPPPGSVVIIRSHGVSRSMHEKLKDHGYEVIDATCPFVRKIHDIVMARSALGEPVVIIGSPDHPEVKGIMGWVTGPCAAVETSDEARALDLPKKERICVVSQTTFNHQKFQDFVEIIKSMGYHVHVTNTICNATKQRQEEAFRLAGESDVMIVIGGRASSNTQKLYDICRGRCKNTYYVQSSDDLSTIKFKSDCCVGITAGASTPNNIIQEVSLNVRRAEF